MLDGIKLRHRQLILVANTAAPSQRVIG
jgi:hypothetical protein